MKLYLTAGELLVEKDWMQSVEEILMSQMYSVFRKGSKLVVWRESDRKHCKEGIEYTDSIQLFRLHLTHGKSALAVGPKRIYFQSDQETPLHTHEYQILQNTARPKGSSRKAQLNFVIKFLKQFRPSAGHLIGQPIEIESMPIDYPKLQIGGHAYSGNNWKPDRAFKDVGFDYVPDEAQVIVIGCGGLGCKEVQPCMEHIRKGFEARHAGQISVQSMPMTKMQQQITNLESGKRKPFKTHTVFHMVLPNKENPLDSQTKFLMAGLDRAGVNWRRSYATDPLQYAVPDQLGSLLQGMEGRSYRITMPEEFENLWSVGIDLSHPTDGPSKLCVSLVDPGGGLAGVWRKIHNRDETISAKFLGDMLLKTADAARKITPDARFLVLRDGRLFENETASQYLTPFNKRASLLEIRKNNNPLIAGAEKSARLPTKPVWAVVPGTKTGFLITHTEGGVLKITWRSCWNNLNITTDQIGQILLCLAMAPPLGIQQAKLPSPLYWADGIAAASDNELKFCGQNALFRPR